ncbi:hypothetical protein HAX54_038077 [Datura stramonium]|uniref:Putative plant transposon protein domain-containing protein n=1 Tax=Datura stramonium TaxID=4076 RepID=A0ABS8SHZ7_DATST|nr:hypothetical protein [Datura stramonium]
MTPKSSKGKGVASSSHGSKRSKRASEEEHDDVSIPQQPLRRYGLHWVTEKKEPRDRSNQVKIRGQIINFAPTILNKILDTPNVDPQPLVDIVKKPPYRDIIHTLCGPNSVARWIRHQQYGYHVSFPYAHLSREACVWLKIICAYLVPGKHVTHITRERVCLFYTLMTGVPVNGWVIIKNVLRRARVRKGQSFGFGGLVTPVLHGHQIEEEADHRPIYEPRGIHVTKTKEPKDIHDPVISVNERNA